MAAVDTIDSEEIEELFPPRKSVITKKPQEEGLIQVVGIEPITNQEFEKKVEEQVKEPDTEEYMINDFEDTDYISFNDLLEGGNENANSN